MNQKQKTDVAIVEDKSALAASLREVLDSSDQCRCAGVWTTGEDALRKVAATRPDVILMDINLPGISGIEATARIKYYLPEIRVIMLTIYRDHDKIFAALKAGASGYLLKRASPTDVRDAIQDVLTGGAPMSAEIARRVVEAFHHPSPKRTDENSLSPRESEILHHLSEGLVNKEIAARLDISVETVRVHVKHIYEKLHVRSRVEAAMKYRDTKEPDNWMR